MKLFLSYRRSDPVAHSLVGWLHEKLESHIGGGNVFMDVDRIPIGTDFRVALANAVSTANAMLVLIGPQWSSLMVARTNESQDFVRLEIEAAFDQDLVVVPVLVGGASMPAEHFLPKTISKLAFIQAARLGEAHEFARDVKALVESLRSRIDLSRETQHSGTANLGVTPPQTLQEKRRSEDGDVVVNLQSVPHRSGAMHFSANWDVAEEFVREMRRKGYERESIVNRLVAQGVEAKSAEAVVTWIFQNES